MHFENFKALSACEEAGFEGGFDPPQAERTKAAARRPKAANIVAPL
jgi:hypothetical protein